MCVCVCLGGGGVPNSIPILSLCLSVQCCIGLGFRHTCLIYNIMIKLSFDVMFLLVIEFQKIALATAIGFAIMGFIGFFVKLIHIPINNIIVQ